MFDEKKQVRTFGVMDTIHEATEGEQAERAALHVNSKSNLNVEHKCLCKLQHITITLL